MLTRLALVPVVVLAGLVVLAPSKLYYRQSSQKGNGASSSVIANEMAESRTEWWHYNTETV